MKETDGGQQKTEPKEAESSEETEETEESKPKRKYSVRTQRQRKEKGLEIRD